MYIISLILSAVNATAVYNAPTQQSMSTQSSSASVTTTTPSNNQPNQLHYNSGKQLQQEIASATASHQRTSQHYNPVYPGCLETDIRRLNTILEMERNLEAQQIQCHQPQQYQPCYILPQQQQQLMQYQQQQMHVRYEDDSLHQLYNMNLVPTTKKSSLSCTDINGNDMGMSTTRTVQTEVVEVPQEQQMQAAAKRTTSDQNQQTGTLLQIQQLSVPPVTNASWYYVNPQGIIQGPLNGVVMHQWLEAGYFKSDTPISQSNSGPFLPLKVYFPPKQRSPPPPASPVIHLNTKEMNKEKWHEERKQGIKHAQRLVPNKSESASSNISYELGSTHHITSNLDLHKINIEYAKSIFKHYLIRELEGRLESDTTVCVSSITRRTNEKRVWVEVVYQVVKIEDSKLPVSVESATTLDGTADEIKVPGYTFPSSVNARYHVSLGDLLKMYGKASLQHLYNLKEVAPLSSAKRVDQMSANDRRRQHGGVYSFEFDGKGIVRIADGSPSRECPSPNASGSHQSFVTSPMVGL